MSPRSDHHVVRPRLPSLAKIPAFSLPRGLIVLVLAFGDGLGWVAHGARISARQWRESTAPAASSCMRTLATD